MTPKEKAKELVDKYDFDHNEFDYSKEYALIAVDEILKQFDKIKVSHIINGYITYKNFEENLTSIQNQLDSQMISKWSYWNEVKQEINKL